MSFQNFETFPNQHGTADTTAAATGAPATADTTMTGQSDPSPAPFQGPTPGEPSTAPGPQPGVDAKTTLWYVCSKPPWPLHSAALLRVYPHIKDASSILLIAFLLPPFRLHVG